MAEFGKDKLMDIAKLLSTPKELCKHCLEWCEGDFNDIPHCVDGHNSGVKCVDGILIVCYEPISEVDVVYSDADYENAHWEEVRYSDLVYYDVTLLKIAEFIHEYVED